MSPSINIAIIAGQLVVGGAERQLFLWLSNLDRSHFNPIVLTLHPGNDDYWEKPIEQLGIPLFRIAQRRNRWARLKEIIKVIRPFHPNLIHGWHLFASGYAGLAAKWLDARCLGGVRNTFETFSSHRLESKLMLWTADAIVANSKETAKAIQESFRRGPEWVFAVQNAIEDDFISRSEIRSTLIKTYHLPEDAEWIVSMGRFEPLKKFDWLIEVTAALQKIGKRVHLVLIGDGQELGYLKKTASSRDVLADITFTGEIPMASRWLKAFDIFCFPSLDEGMPNVIMEAAAAGLPIVTWQLPFYKELLSDNQTALLVPPSDLSAMRKALGRLIDNPDLRKKIGTTAQAQILENFSLSRYIIKMTTVYETVLNNRL